MVIEKTFGSKAFDVLLVVLLGGIALLCVLPLWYTLVISLSENAAASAGQVGLWRWGLISVPIKKLWGTASFSIRFGFQYSVLR